jgi:hypothetical protein
MLTMPPNFSIIVCTFNPIEHLFNRTLQAIAALELRKEIVVECVIVDNNSAPEIIQFHYVQTFLAQCPWARVVREPKQGLTFARIAGIKASSASVLVFFDDDNEPDKNYLITAQHYLQTYPGVAIWGPGQVNVEFLDPVSDWFKQEFSSKAFQGKTIHCPEFGCLPRGGYEAFYPPGTGQLGLRSVFEHYVSAVETGELKSTGRKGKSLSSAEDIQIVWEAIKLGFSAGLAPGLKLNHLIPANRSTVEYVKPLTFGTASSYIPALVDSFPDAKEQALVMPSNFKIIATVIKKLLNVRYWFQPALLEVDLANYLGAIVGIMRARGNHDQEWIYKLAKWLGFE